MRTVLLLILCLAIPLQGFAAVVVFEPHCPMETTAVGDMADVSAMHDCCNDADTAAKTGKVCKAGQECQSASLYPLFPPVAHSFMPSVAEYVSLIEPFIHAFSPSGLWRPPTQL